MATVGRHCLAVHRLSLVRFASRAASTRAAESVVKAPIKVFGIEGRYAHAVFSAASSKKMLDKVEGELNDFQKLVTTEERLSDFIRNPTLNKFQKRQGIMGILKDLKYSDLTVNLFGALAENNRLPRSLGVVKAYGTIMSAYRGEVSCTVTTAKPLDEKTRKEVEDTLKGFVDKKQVIKMESKTDPSIIGGMVVEVGDKYIDMSISTKLKKMVETLKEAL